MKDLIDEHGYVMSDLELYKRIRVKQNIHQEIYVVKNYIIKHIKNIDISIAPFVKIKGGVTLMFNNKSYDISNQKSKVFFLYTHQ